MVTLRSRLLAFQGKIRTQHFMRDSLCQQKLMEPQLLLVALLNVRSTRESTRDPGAEKASLAKFCKGCMHQHVFGCEFGVLPAVPPNDVKVSPLPPRTYTIYAFVPAPCACALVCKNRHTGTSIFTATHNTFYEHLSPNTPSKL